jgi:hypothetical protein
MNTSHAKALRSFARNLQWLLTLRLAVQLATVWLFIWGVVVLALRIFGMRNNFWLFIGLSGILPLLILAWWQTRKRQPAFANIRANYDRLNACGGIIMTQEAAEMGSWLRILPEAVIPRFHWHNGRALSLLFISGLFVATALLLPERLTQIYTHRPLEIGQILQQLRAEVKVLAREKIVSDQKADDLQKQLSQLQRDSSGYDPDKTWEALDHIKQANSEAAKEAAQEALDKTESLTEGETLAKAMEMAAENGMEQATAAQAAQDLASLLDSSKLETGILNGQISPELLQNLNGLNKEQLEKLAQALALKKDALSLTVSNLANLKMIDAATLAKCLNAAQTPDFESLALYLSHCQGGKCDSDELFSWLRKRCRGGLGRGGPEAPMDWDNNTSEDNLKFQAHALPPSAHLADAQIVGLSKAAPQLSQNDISAQHGALDNALAGGGSGYTRVILPEHREAVQNFFKRDQ